MSLIEKIDAVYNEHPYKVVGDVSTYSQYNEGWSDACDRLLVVLSEQKEPLTIGDKIRESNESLSAFIRGQFGDDRVFHDGKQIDFDDFLNQPIES